MKYATICDYPLNDKLVIVEATSRDEALAKTKFSISLISQCEPEEVSLYNCCDELTKPSLVLYYETGHGGPIEINERNACDWETNPLILLGDCERDAAYRRYYQAMQDRADYLARKSILNVK